jgi:hypothetical protein
MLRRTSKRVKEVVDMCWSVDVHLSWRFREKKTQNRNDKETDFFISCEKITTRFDPHRSG